MPNHTTPPAGLAYLRFLNLVSAIRRIHPVLDPMEERLLNMVSAAWNAGQQVTVMEAMSNMSDASPATVHRRLKTLRSKGMLDLQVDDGDNRVKYIIPTPKALAYFDSLSQCMLKAQMG